MGARVLYAEVGQGGVAVQESVRCVGNFTELGRWLRKGKDVTMCMRPWVAVWKVPVTSTS